MFGAIYVPLSVDMSVNVWSNFMYLLVLVSASMFGAIYVPLSVGISVNYWSD